MYNVKSLSTKLPFDFLKNGKLCDDKSGTPDFDRSSEVKMMKLQPLNLPFFDSYTANNFLLATSKTTSVENRLKNYSPLVAFVLIIFTPFFAFIFYFRRSFC